METKKRESRAQAFVLTPEELAKICLLFPEDANLVIEITCRDNVDRKYKFLPELLEFENAVEKEITEFVSTPKKKTIEK
jgi:hypothetical protein